MKTVFLVIIQIILGLGLYLFGCFIYIFFWIIGQKIKRIRERN